MFNTKTRAAIRVNEAGFGNALAGRGPQLNEAFGSLRNLVISAEPALGTLVAPQTNFGGFWHALEDLSATVAPVAETQASLFVALDETFGAFARVSRPFIQETISKSPSTLDAANADLPVLRPFLHDSQRFFTALQPGAAALAKTSPTIAAALRAGIPALNALPTLNAQLVPTAEALLAFQNAPGVFNGLDLLIDTNHTLGPAINFIAPAQTTCNYLTLAFKNIASATSEEQRARQLAQLHLYGASGRPQQRGLTLLRASQRPRSRKPSPLQPLPEHRLSWPARYLRSGQRPLQGRPDRDRQCPGQPRHQDLRSAEGPG